MRALRGIILILAFAREIPIATASGNIPSLRSNPAVAVFLHEENRVPAPVLARAKWTATEIFAAIGVRLVWSFGPSKRLPAGAFAADVQFDAQLPKDLDADVFAYALPYKSSGTRIHILFDHIVSSAGREQSGALLGHVIAHEIAHVLEQTDRHSGGVMKAHWDVQDRARMTTRSLTFDATDAELIQTALEKARAQSHVEATLALRRP